MIDYIKIMNLIIAFIRSTAIPVDLDSLLNSNDIKNTCYKSNND